MKQIIAFFQKLEEWLFFLFFMTGIILALPVKLLHVILKKSVFAFYPFRQDREDTHTFKHFSLAILLVLFGTKVFQFSPFWAFWFSFGLLYFYELLDGLKIIDQTGIQYSDLGADFWGATIAAILIQDAPKTAILLNLSK